MLFHPRLPYILSTGEDNRTCLFHSGTFRRERVLVQPTLDRCWSLAVSPHSNWLVLGYDEGFCVYTMGRDLPPASMDVQGRFVWSVRQEVKQGLLEEKRNDFAQQTLKGAPVVVVEKEISWDRTERWINPSWVAARCHRPSSPTTLTVVSSLSSERANASSTPVASCAARPSVRASTLCGGREETGTACRS